MSGIALIFGENNYYQERVINGKLFHPAGIVATKWLGVSCLVGWVFSGLGKWISGRIVLPFITSSDD